VVLNAFKKGAARQALFKKKGEKNSELIFLPPTATKNYCYTYICDNYCD
jgi:hypothetical protein